MEVTEDMSTQLEYRTASYQSKVSAIEQQTSYTLTNTLKELDCLARSLCDPEDLRGNITFCLSACQSRLCQMQDLQEALFQLKEETADLITQSARYKATVQNNLTSLEGNIQSLDKRQRTLIDHAAVTADNALKLDDWQIDTSKFAQVAGAENVAKASKWQSINKVSAWTIPLGIGVLTTPVTYAFKKHHDRKIAVRTNAQQLSDEIAKSRALEELDLLLVEQEELIALRKVLQAYIERASELANESASLSSRSLLLLKDCESVTTTTSQLLRAMRKLQCRKGERTEAMTDTMKSALCAAMADMVMTIGSNNETHLDHLLLSDSLALHIAMARSLQVTHGTGLEFYGREDDGALPGESVTRQQKVYR